MAHFPETFRFRIPAGFSEAIAAAAAREGLAASAYIRRLLIREVRRGRSKAANLSVHNGPTGRLIAA